MILIVDDDEMTQMVLMNYCDKMGKTYLCLYNGLNAVNKVLEHGSQVVFLDVFMDTQEGLKTLQQLKTYCKCGVIMISADEHYLAVSKDLGANCTLKKPISFDDFRRVLEDEKCTNQTDLSTEGTRL